MAALIIAGGIALVLLAILIQLGLLTLAGFMAYWNITDIANVGVNFWNVFWLATALLIVVSVVGSWFRSDS